jgi:hypothetical protein
VRLALSGSFSFSAKRTVTWRTLRGMPYFDADTESSTTPQTPTRKGPKFCPTVLRKA